MDTEMKVVPISSYISPPESNKASCINDLVRVEQDLNMTLTDYQVYRESQNKSWKMLKCSMGLGKVQSWVAVLCQFVSTSRFFYITQVIWLIVDIKIGSELKVHYRIIFHVLE